MGCAPLQAVSSHYAFLPLAAAAIGACLATISLCKHPPASGLPDAQGIAGNNLHTATVTATEPSWLVVAVHVRASDHVQPTKTDAC